MYRFSTMGVNIINIYMDLIDFIQKGNNRHLITFQNELRELEKEGRFKENEFRVLNGIIEIALSIL